MTKSLEYHGLTGRKKNQKKQPPEYQIWSQIKQRCFNPNHPKYAEYGGCGIGMDSDWANSFTTFLGDVGPRPEPKMQIGRIDVKQGYFPGNVKWVSRTEANRNTSRNRFITYEGKRMVYSEAAEQAGMDRRRLRERLRAGYSVKAAMELPVEGGALYMEYDGETHNLAEWARIKGIPYNTLHSRTQRLGWTTKEAFETPAHEERPRKA